MKKIIPFIFVFVCLFPSVALALPPDAQKTTFVNYLFFIIPIVIFTFVMLITAKESKHLEGKGLLPLAIYKSLKLTYILCVFGFAYYLIALFFSGSFYMVSITALFFERMRIISYIPALILFTLLLFLTAKRRKIIIQIFLFIFAAVWAYTSINLMYSPYPEFIDKILRNSSWIFLVFFTIFSCLISNKKINPHKLLIKILFYLGLSLLIASATINAGVFQYIDIDTLITLAHNLIDFSPSFIILYILYKITDKRFAVVFLLNNGFKKLKNTH